MPRRYWGRGVATRALVQFLEVVTERPLYAVVAEHNAASLRVLAKCGFTVVEKSRGAPGARGPAVDELVLKLAENPGPAAHRFFVAGATALATDPELEPICGSAVGLNEADQPQWDCAFGVGSMTGKASSSRRATAV